jgi:hypothetical protein
MNAPSTDIIEILVSSTKGLDLIFGTNLFQTFMPETPNFCVSVNDSGGYDPQSNYVYEKPTIQILVRGKLWGYTAAYAQIKEIHNVLHDLHGEVWGGSKYIGIWTQGCVLPLGYDNNNRPMLSLNFRIHRTTT